MELLREDDSTLTWNCHPELMEAGTTQRKQQHRGPTGAEVPPEPSPDTTDMKMTNRGAADEEPTRLRDGETEKCQNNGVQAGVFSSGCVNMKVVWKLIVNV